MLSKHTPRDSLANNNNSNNQKREAEHAAYTQLRQLCRTTTALYALYLSFIHLVLIHTRKENVVVVVVVVSQSLKRYNNMRTHRERERQNEILCVCASYDIVGKSMDFFASEHSILRKYPTIDYSALTYTHSLSLLNIC